MEKLIVVEYAEFDDERFEVYLRLKCLPYNFENLERVTKYVKALNSVIGECFEVSFRVKSGTDKEELEALIRDGKDYLPVFYVEHCVKFYRNNERLPYENALSRKGTSRVQILLVAGRIPFGEHPDDAEDDIGED